MKYRILGKTGEKVSVLGFGTMRLPVIDEDPKRINESEVVRMIRYAVDQGVNYIDTAYIYHGGKAEGTVAKVLQDGYRQKVMLATKLPIWKVKKSEDMPRLLDEQLNNLQTDYIDFYMVHSLGRDYWQKLLDMGLLEFLNLAKESGKVRYVGFSFHDDYELFQEIVDSYPWSVCQIQYNYLDENFQAGKKGLQYAFSKGLGVVIMEPIRGGTLADKLSGEAQQIIKQAPGKRTAPELALKWVWDHKEVGIVLSGMTEMQHVIDNINYAEESEIPLSEVDRITISAIQKSYAQKAKVECTACKYCMPCPSGVNISQCFDYFNRAHMMEDVKGLLLWYGKLLGKASDCVECGECETHCPQNIEIREKLKEVKELFGT